jgi:hypothetical protein
MTDTNQGASHPVPVALALLDRRWPASPALADALAGLEQDPRYLIGRLQQALTILMADGLPSMDAQTALLSQALADAIAWRQHRGRPCRQCGTSLCGPCNADWDQADRYHELARALGAVGDLPPSSAPPVGAAPPAHAVRTAG